MKFTRTETFPRAVRGLLVVLASTAALAGIPAAASASAPEFGVALSHSPTLIPRSDQRVVYAVAVSNTADPKAQVGQELSCAENTWSGSPTQFAYQWLRDGMPIINETGKTYTVQQGDASSSLQCLVTAPNAGGASSEATAPVLVAPAPATLPPAPADPTKAAARPTVTGTASVGRAITCRAPTGWDDGPTWSYQWLRNGVPLVGNGADTDSYTVQAADVPGVLQCEATATNAGGSAVAISSNKNTSPRPSPSAPANSPANSPTVNGPTSTSGPVTLHLELPAGMNVFEASGNGWTTAGGSCTVQRTPTSLQPASVTCIRSDVLGPGAAYPALNVVAAIGSGAPDTVTATATISGGGAAQQASEQDTFSFGPFVPFGVAPGSFTTSVVDAAGSDYTQAGGHPYSAGASFAFNTHIDAYGKDVPTEHVRDIRTNLPAGFIGNPQAVTQRCATIDDVQNSDCPAASAVGGVIVHTAGADYPSVVYAISPERGAPAEFSFQIGLTWVYTLKARLRPDDTYAISVDAPQVGKAPEITGVDLTLCGFGTETSKIVEATFNGCVAPASGSGVTPAPGSCVTGSLFAPTQCRFPRPFLTNPTECSQVAPFTTLSVDSWEHPAVVKTYEAISPKVTGCDKVPFDPSISLQPTTRAADSPTGLNVSIQMPTDGLEDPNELAQANLKRAVVKLPAGTAVSPAAADGLGACTPAQIGLGTNDEPSCPDSSKVGTVQITTPLLDTPVTGGVYLAQQDNNPFHTLLALYIVAESKERGVVIKLPGRVDLDSHTGRLTATFDDNPQLPFSDMELHFFGGPRAALATPSGCGSYSTASVLSPWSGTAPVASSDPFTVDQSCDAASGFSPKLEAGVVNPAAGGSSPFTLTLSRDSGENLAGMDVRLPRGLLAALKGVPLCPDSAAVSGECPAASKIGHVTVAAGPGSHPLYIPQAGKAPTAVYLAGPYKGGPYSLVIEVPAQAGPFDLGVVTVRAALHVDPETAQVSVKSDPMPQILDGIPLEYRKVIVSVDRKDFMRSPTNCRRMRVHADVHGAPLGGPVKVTPGGLGIAAATDAVAHLANRFQVGGCGALPFKPRMKMRLQGKRQRRDGGHPGLVTVVREPKGQANIKAVRVALPLSIALDPKNSQHVCDYDKAKAVHGTKAPCPKSTIIGRAVAKTPLLPHKLRGRVYLVQGIRFNKEGERIKTLPTLLVPLRGKDHVAIDLRAKTNVSHKKLVTTFRGVPDAQISSFKLHVFGASKKHPKGGLLVVTHNQNICRGKQVTDTTYRGQSGARYTDRVHMKTPCKGVKKARRVHRLRRAAHRAARRGHKAKARKAIRRIHRLRNHARRGR